ncbi:MAG: molecular chaperone TorD family protein [Desulfatitalea sp.]|nr:molecular chaperone TorD family protein [Desulfatitalea sp.]NNK02685.1 molecular chaperone TorD family protein [Desulfatitalea sp.]
MYQLLAIGFADPTLALSRGLIDGGFQTDALAVMEGLRMPPSAVSQVASSFQAVTESIDNADAGAFYHQLNVAYARLFIGPGPVVVSPYESIHTDEDPSASGILIVGPVTSAVLKSYRQAGVSLLMGINDPPDHMAIELEFLYYLCDNEAGAWKTKDLATAEKWRGLQSAFTTDHLLKWGPPFCRQVRDATRESFYAVLSLVAETFFSWESNFLRQ